MSPLFADIELAARIELAERGLLQDCLAAVAQRRPEVELYREALSGGLAGWAGEGSPFNKIAGLGFGGPIDEDELGVIEEEFARRGAPVQVELARLAEPEVGEMLTGRGYLLVGYENVLGAALPMPKLPASGAGIAVSPSADSELDTWIDVLVDGFCAPDTQGIASHESFPREALEPVMRDMAVAAGFTRFLARIDGTPVGGASMRMANGVTHLCGAATLPAWRRRGVQTALLGHRLRIAADAGGEVVVMITQPGSKSQQNAQAMGFSLLYSRAVLVRPS